jgi:hypothetical protein
MLGEAFLKIISSWRPCFARAKSFERSVALSLGQLCGIGRGTTTRGILALGRQDQDWSAFYRLCSRAPWIAESLFTCAFKESLRWIKSDWVTVAYDDTRLKKTGKKIAEARYCKDPLSPPFHANLMYGLRFLQCSVLLPLHTLGEARARAVPISFELSPNAKKPGKTATQEQIQEYKLACKVRNLSTAFVANLARQRAILDSLGGFKRLLVATVDGSFCNKNCMEKTPERTVIVARARKDAKLCFPAQDGPRNKQYASHKFTPEEVLKDEAIPFLKAEVFFGGARRELRYKMLENVLWQGGTKTRRVTLLALAPTPFKNSQAGKRLYRQPAFLICTSTGLDAVRVLQAYLDRWQIEVNHREEKDTLGIGQAQVRSKKAVPRQPAMIVAAYSILILAALRAFGPGRSKPYPQLPKWRRDKRRASIPDMICVLRAEWADPTSALSLRVKPPPGFQNLVMTAAA